MGLRKEKKKKHLIYTHITMHILYVIPFLFLYFYILSVFSSLLHAFLSPFFHFSIFLRFFLLFILLCLIRTFYFHLVSFFIVIYSYTFFRHISLFTVRNRLCNFVILFFSFIYEPFCSL